MATKKTTEPTAKDITVNLNLKTISIPIEGIAPLIMSRFDEKSKQQIEESGPGKLKQGKGKKAAPSPEEQYQRSIYYFADGKRIGFPAVAFKAAMVRAAQVVFGRTMTTTKTVFRVMADDPETGLVEIHGEHKMREDMVRVGTMNKVASPRYRACFPVWSAVITIQFIADVISEEEIAGILNAAGFCCGVGEWRPEKANSGSFGMFKVAAK